MNTVGIFSVPISGFRFDTQDHKQLKEKCLYITKTKSYTENGGGNHKLIHYYDPRSGLNLWIVKDSVYFMTGLKRVLLNILTRFSVMSVKMLL